ncbi:MAG: SARP family transcriptional regulator [Lachnospiraceae bacterium]|nr:SARP family transcriptional regulator [Lachnospiraceae bacterium]
MEKEYYITMLGEFKICRGQNVVTTSAGRSGKSWNLLEYIIANRARHLPHSELEELLWDEEDSGNPAGALKVLLHRARKSLESIPTDNGSNLVVLKHGEYYWNEDVQTVVDVDLFVCAYESFLNATDESERLNRLQTAVGLYKGDFLANNNASWVIPLSSGYHKMYVNAVKKLADIYAENADFTSVVSLCEEAVSIEGQDEELYYRLIYALYMSGRQEEALDRYRHVTDLFYSRFAITPSDELKDLYKTIMRSTRKMETDINVIKDNLTEHGDVTGAFECEYGVFKDVYQLEARACARNGDSIYLCLVTLEAKTDEEISQKNMNRAIQHLERAISETLRKGDVFSRFSVVQYVILLPAAAYENVVSVLKRITSAFNRKYLKKDINVVWAMQPIEPK